MIKHDDGSVTYSSDEWVNTSPFERAIDEKIAKMNTLRDEVFKLINYDGRYDSRSRALTGVQQMISEKEIKMHIPDDAVAKEPVSDFVLQRHELCQYLIELQSELLCTQDMHEFSALLGEASVIIARDLRTSISRTHEEFKKWDDSDPNYDPN